MKKTWMAFALMFCLSFAACGGPVSPAVGTWVLDGEAALKSFEANPPEGMPPQALEPMKNMIKGMKGEMTMNADGTFEGVMEMPNPMTGEVKPSTAKGTWTLEGEKLSITTTEQDGKPEETPDTETAVLKDGVITVTPAGAPFSILFKKK
jgi:hypothetical protein